MSAPPLAPGAVVGILGGGQLGRMTALAAARLGFDVSVYADAPDSPAARVAARSVVGPPDDADAVAAFARTCDVVTYEYEHVPLAAAEAAAAEGVLRPGVASLAESQDRGAEKALAARCAVGTARYALIDAPSQIAPALQELGGPALLKTRRFGYDGKGQVRVEAPVAAEAAWTAIGAKPAILEALVPFAREISIVAARGVDGAFAAYDVAENRHEGGVLRESCAPAPDGDLVAAEGRAIARRLAEAVDHVGVFTAELFEMPDGALLLNEIAPRVHNSGHWTLDGAVCDQFEQHVRAIVGWPLGSTRARGRWRMRNLLGAEGLAALPAARSDPSARVHVYGKRGAEPGRKLGHVTRPADRG